MIELSLRHWILASFFGWLLGFVLLIGLVLAGESAGLPGSQFIVGLAMGAGVGYGQWRILRNITGTGAGWVISSALGMTGGFLLYEYGLPLLTGSVDESFRVLPAVATGGLLAGLWQSRLLRPGKNPERWILASFLGWLAAGFCATLSDYLPRDLFPNTLSAIVNLVFILCGGAVHGLVTGKLLKGMLRR